MKKISGISIFIFVLLMGFETRIALGSLSASLGATKLDGLTKFTDCQNEAIGYREGLIADRLELKLANTGGISQEERNLWLNDIRILRQVQQTRQPDRTNNQHYFLGLTDQEQQAINSMSQRHTQEIHLKCEQQHGGMLRYSPTSDQSGQLRFENELRAQMGTPIDIATIPAEPLTNLLPKPAAQVEQERKESLKTMQQAAMEKFSQCSASAKGLRPKLIAQTLQRKLESASGMPAKERAELEADVQAAWASAGKGLDLIQSADPGNPYRAEQRLTQQEMMDINNQYIQQYTQMVQGCAAPGR